MVQKETCIEVLEVWTDVFKELKFLKNEEKLYQRCRGVVIFLNEAGVLSSEESIKWLDEIERLHHDALLRIYTEGEG